MRPILATSLFSVAFLMLAPKPSFQLSAEEVNEKGLTGFVTEAPEIEGIKNYNFSYLGIDKTFDELASHWAFCPEGVKYYFNRESQQGRIVCSVLNRQPKIDATFLSKVGVIPDNKYLELYSANYIFMFKSPTQGPLSFLGHSLELTWKDGTHREILKSEDNYDAHLLKALTATAATERNDISNMPPEYYYGYMKQLYLGHP
ncbi:hypothetical protein HNP12_003723 [Aeromonas hydrophila]|uniref:hypothetical protein n=1 Tax=Aeromonas hydrophila TaxID=644 RepID=UPI0021686214|nr:hypothetical protein [Aeromonas hydrophila]MCS3769602.1 hypothetical protein [Aeromonas hydrophila]